jgi:hypothetical protein
MASNHTRDKHAYKKRQQWDNGGAYELTEEEKEKVRVARLVWKKRGGSKAS